MYQTNLNYFIQTPTHYFIGTLVNITDTELQLQNCSWIADTGRLTQALQTGNFIEVELYPNPLIIPRTSIICAMLWTLPVPNVQK